MTIKTENMALNMGVGEQHERILNIIEMLREQVGLLDASRERSTMFTKLDELRHWTTDDYNQFLAKQALSTK